jgi:transposase
MKPAEEDWQVDYDPDQGTSAICPACGSSKVELLSNPTAGWSWFECSSCGHESQNW